MITANDCLDAAMFIAAESYSGSAYTIDFPDEDTCSRAPVLMREDDPDWVTAIAA